MGECHNIDTDFKKKKYNTEFTEKSWKVLSVTL